MDKQRRIGSAVVAALLALGSSAAARAQEPAPKPAAPSVAPRSSVTAVPGPSAATAPGSRPLFRIILNDGTALVSYGEFTRVGDRVVFSMPLDGPRGDRLQLVNLPAS